MDIEEYVQKYSKADRIKHINLNTPCEDAYAVKAYRNTKVGDPVTSHSGSMRTARVILKEYLNLSGNTNRRVNVCHLCNNNTKHGQKCVNPEHLYFGTARENQLDKPEDVRKDAASKAGSRSTRTQNQKDAMRKIVQCPHCSKEGGAFAMKRWHFDRCKLK